MQLIELLRNDHLLNAQFALRQANCDNIIELCHAYLLLLNRYQDDLYKLRGTPEINQYSLAPLGRELVNQKRRAIWTAVESTIRERNQTESLLKSFTVISAYEAVETFNQLEYRGYAEWECRANQIRLKNDNISERYTVEESVKLASRLRRTAYISYKTTFYDEL